MAWIRPKTNWKDGDYFNIFPDYIRIKGNIEHLIFLSKEMYPEYSYPELKTVSITDYPDVSFFNNIVNATKAILNNCYSPSNIEPMRLYFANGLGFNANELNAIESNHLYLYNAFTAQKSAIKRLNFKLGGHKIGS